MEGRKHFTATGGHKSEMVGVFAFVEVMVLWRARRYLSLRCIMGWVGGIFHALMFLCFCALLAFIGLSVEVNKENNETMATLVAPHWTC